VALKEKESAAFGVGADDADDYADKDWAFESAP
jgi:hypothetical protein